MFERRTPLISLASAAALAAPAMLFVLMPTARQSAPLLARALLLTFAALLPVGLLGLAFFRLDRREREPLRNLSRYLLLGIVSAGLAVLFHRGARLMVPTCWWEQFGWGGEALRLLLVVGAGEEMCKYLMFRLGAAADDELDEPYDACLYAAVVGLGFAGVENLLYVVDPLNVVGGMRIAFVRAASAVPGHAFFAALWGMAFGLGRFRPRVEWATMWGLPLMMAVHGLYDWIGAWSARLQQDALGILLLIALMVALSLACLRLVRLAHDWSPHPAPDGNRSRAA